MSNIAFIDEVEITNKKVLLRADLNVSLRADATIADDARIRQSLPTINYLLKNNNTLIIISHLGRPKGKDPKFSLKPVVDRLQSYLPDYKVVLIEDFSSGVILGRSETTTPESLLKNYDSGQVLRQAQDIAGMTNKTIYVLENIRFFPQEKKNDVEFAKKLANLADIFVQDGFGVCHRKDASVVGINQFLPSYGGLLLKKEIKMLSKVIESPQRPVVAIIGGAKITTKIDLLNKLLDIAECFIIGGGLANTFIRAKNYEIGNSLCEEEGVESAKKILLKAEIKSKYVILPSDVVVGNKDDDKDGGQVFKISQVPGDANILDIGPETQAKIGAIIAQAKTIIWNGPVGYFENPNFRRGTDFIYYSISQNGQAISVVGGGDTLAAISKKEYLDKITHISTGGGAMLEFIEKGTLPGIEALKHEEIELLP